MSLILIFLLFVSIVILSIQYKNDITEIRDTLNKIKSVSLCNLWHDSNIIPVRGCHIVIRDIEDNLSALEFQEDDDWESIVKDKKLYKWAYFVDIIEE